MKKIIPVLAFIPMLMLFASCGIPKPFQHTTYFTDSITEGEKNAIEVPTVIRPGDRLSISITAINKEAAAAFNLSGGSSAAGGEATSYLVDSLGNIKLLQLGTTRVAGLSTVGLADSLENRLQDYLKGPLATVNIINFKISIFGEVGHPSVVPVPDGKITILEALTQSGDLTLYSKRQNILVIRQENGKRQFGRVDITSNHIFESPYYNLQQNDIVYVEPDKTKFISNNPALERDLRNLGIATTLLSTVLLIINLTKL